MEAFWIGFRRFGLTRWLNGKHLVRARCIEIDLVIFTERAVLIPELSKVFCPHLLQAQRSVLCVFSGSNQLVDFEMQNVIVTVLRVLDQKNHQEGDDGSGRVDDQLPGIVVVKVWPRKRPNSD